MYKPINLLPPAIREKQQGKRLVFLVILASILGAACFVSIWFVLKIQNADLENSLNNSAALATVSNDSATVGGKTAMDINQDALNRVSIINTQAKKEIDWEKAFTVVNSLVDKKMILNNYSMVSSASGLKLKMAGTVSSNVDFANYVEFLKLSKDFRGMADGYAYDPKTGKVTFVVTGDIPLSQLIYEAKKQ